MPKASPALKTLIDGATSKNGASNAKKNGIGSTPRLCCYWDASASATDPATSGAKFLDCAIAGPLFVDTATGVIKNFGATSDVVLHNAVDLAQGSAALRIEGNGNYLQYSLGLTGSGREFTVPANLTPGQPFAFSPNASINPLASLPLNDAGENPPPDPGPAPVPVGSTIATLAVKNESGSSVASGFIPPMLGHPFKKGDIPTGYYPMFELEDATFVPCTMFNVTKWSDGSLKFASFLIRVPGSVAGSGSINVRIKATTSAPGASSRTLADFSSGSTDLQVAVTGADQLSGEWISRLNQGITDNDDVILFGDGPVGKVWRIRQQFMQSGSNHGQLECYWYVAALQDAAGNLYGLRHLARVSQPWYNVDAPAKSYRTFSSMKLNNGASLIRECVNAHAVTATLPSAGYYLTANGHGLTNMRVVRFTGTTLPTGLAANTSYTVANPSTNSFSLKTIPGDSDVALSGTPSGDFKIQALICVPHFCSVYTAGPSGKWDFTQAGGSVALDANVRIIHDKAYWMTTGVVPAYENVTVAAQEAFPYEPNYMGPVASEVNGSGERPDIGVLPEWHVNHLLSQSASAEQTMRTVGLAVSNTPITCLNATTKTFVPVNAGTYAGMPASNPDFRCRPNLNAGFTAPGPGPKMLGIDKMDFSHKPSFSYYPYLVTGEPQMLDMVLETAWLTVAHEYTPVGTQDSTGKAGRNITINGTTYRGLTALAASLRESAWGTRDAAYAAGICPDTAPQCASYKQYFNDINSANFAALLNYFTNVAPAYQKTVGFVHFEDFPFVDMWMHGYSMTATSMAAKLTENADALTHLNTMAKFPAYVYQNFGFHYVPAFETMVRSAPDYGPFITGDSQMTFYGAGATWDATTNVFSSPANYVGAGNGFVPANGTVVMWDGEGYNGSKPSNLAVVTPYYMVNVSGTSFQLSATPGGAALSLGNTSSGAYFYKAPTMPSGSIHGIPNSSSYATNIVGALKLAKAAGASVNQALITELETHVASVDYGTTGMKYRFADHF